LRVLRIVGEDLKEIAADDLLRFGESNLSIRRGDRDNREVWVVWQKNEIKAGNRFEERSEIG
jgi:hypothetical protein